MCLAVPGEIVEILGGGDAVVNFMGVRKKVSLALIENPAAGEYVIVHAGFAISRLNRQDAVETIELLRELGESPG
jgi:hydrogenase expression/formation protein HypC